MIDQYDPPCKEDLGCSTPQLRTYIVEGYAGTSVTLRLRGTSPLGNRTRAFFDDVSLRQVLGG